MKFKNGDRVKIVDANENYKSLSEIEYGTVGYIRNQERIGVLIDNAYNSNSTKGWFYFNSNSLEPCRLSDEKNDIIRSYRIASIIFLDSEKCIDYALFDEDIQEGDYCVVKSANHGYGVARIKAIRDYNPSVKVESCGNIREIVCKIDMSKYFQRVESREKARIFEKNIRSFFNKDDLMFYRVLSKNFPELKSMFDSYDEYVKKAGGIY